MADEKWSLDEVTARYLEAKSNGTPKETLSWFLDQHGYTPASLTMAAERQGKKDNALPPEEIEQGGGFWNKVMDGVKYSEGMANNLMTGGSWGLTVPLRALGRWGGSKISDSPETYAESLSAIQAQDRKWADENPTMATTTEGSGAIASGAVAAKALTTGIKQLAPVAGKTITNFAKRVLPQSMLGAAEGTGIATAKGENPLLGTIFGVGGGAAGELAGPLLSKTKKVIFGPAIPKNPAVPTPFQSKKAPSKADIEAEQMIEEVDLKDGVTPEMKQQKLQEYADHNLEGEVQKVDIMGKKGQELAGTIMRHGSKVPDKAEKELVARAGRVRGHLYKFLQQASGGTRMSLDEGKDVFKKAAKEESQPLYNAAFYHGGKKSGGMRTVSSPELNELFKMSEFKSAYKRAIKIAGNDKPPVTLPPIPKGGFKEGHQFPVYALDKVKKAINTKFGQGFLNPDPNVQAMSSSMGAHNNDMLDIIGDVVPEYKQAREIYAGSMEFKDASELGEKLFDSGDSFDKIYQHGNKLKTESERREFRSAAFNVLAKKIEGSSVNPKGMAQFFTIPENLRKLELIIPDPEKRGIFMRQTELLSDFVDVKNKIVGGSQTAEKLAADAAEADLTELAKFGGNVATRNYSGLAQQAAGLGSQTKRGARLDSAGGKVYQQGRGNILTNEAGSKATNEMLKKQMRNQTLLSGGMGGGMTSLLNSENQ